MPVLLTRLGLMAERVTQAFWPFWTVLFIALAPLIMGWQDQLPLEAFWAYAVIAVAALSYTLYRGIRALDWPTEADAVARVDARLPGRPIAALNDVQAIGAGDAASEAIWTAHLARMEAKTRDARAVEPDLRVSSKDPYGIRYMAVLFMVVALLFGSIWRVGSVADAATGGEILATGPVWEGWIEPPSYTGKPTLYLADIVANRVQIPQGSFVTLRLYGDVGDLLVTETVSGRAPDADQEIGVEGEDPATNQQQGFEVTQAGTLTIQGDGGASWQILLLEDEAPTVDLTGPIEADALGEMSQPFMAMDDYGIQAGTATIELNLAAVDRRYGLTPDPDPRDAVVLDLPMPFSGDRADFEEMLIDDFSEHPWANLPVTLTLQVEDGLGQTGASNPEPVILPGRRFFQPIARAVIEQRRDILWSKANGRRVAQVLRAVSYRPDDLFPNETTYLRLRTIIRRIENMADTGLTDELQDEVALALWELAVQLEEGSLADARARLERAQERLEEAMRNGASDEEIAELMQELREAMNQYMQMLADQMEPSDGDGTDQPDQGEDGQTITQDELQAMMDRIQELMEEGRMAEAMELMEQLNQLMENLQMTEGEGGEGGPQTPGQQAMEDLAETLRDQQDLTDEAFRELQEQFNQGQEQGQQPGEQPGQQPGQQGQQGQQPGQQPGQGQDGQGGQQPGQQQGQGQGQGDNTQGGITDGDGQGGEGGGNPQDLAERQQALRNGLNQLRNGLPGLSGEAADNAERSLERAEGAMDGAEDALRGGDLAEAIDQQAEALDALRDGLRNLGEALAENQMDELQEGQGTQTGNAEGRPEPERRDPLGRQLGNTGQFGTEESMLQDEVNRRAEELLQELRERSADQGRPQIELDYLRRLLDRF